MSELYDRIKQIRITLKITHENKKIPRRAEARRGNEKEERILTGCRYLPTSKAVTPRMNS